MTYRPKMGSRRGKQNDPDYKPLVSIKQHIPTGNLYLGFAFGRGVEVKRGSDDWLDTIELLQDLCPGQLGANVNDKGPQQHQSKRK